MKKHDHSATINGMPAMHAPFDQCPEAGYVLETNSANFGSFERVASSPSRALIQKRAAALLEAGRHVRITVNGVVIFNSKEVK